MTHMTYRLQSRVTCELNYFTSAPAESAIFKSFFYESLAFIIYQSCGMFTDETFASVSFIDVDITRFQSSIKQARDHLLFYSYPHETLQN